MSPIDREKPDRHLPSRRKFLKGVGIATAAGTLATATIESRAQDVPPVSDTGDTPGLKQYGRNARNVSLNVNGKKLPLDVEPRTTLLDALRMQAKLTGTKEICDRGSCGGCTVLIDGEAVNSCLVLAIDAVGRDIMTVEGIANDPKYASLIESFVENDAAQCGYCVPGFVVRSAELLKTNPKATREEIQHQLAGNLCRCGTYYKIFDAIEAARDKGLPA